MSTTMMANRAYICDMNALYISGFEPLARNRGGGGGCIFVQYSAEFVRL